jgi:hypothetical protein
VTKIGISCEEWIQLYELKRLKILQDSSEEAVRGQHSAVLVNGFNTAHESELAAQYRSVPIFRVHMYHYVQSKDICNYVLPMPSTSKQPS